MKSGIGIKDFPKRHPGFKLALKQQVEKEIAVKMIEVKTSKKKW